MESVRTKFFGTFSPTFTESDPRSHMLLHGRACVFSQSPRWGLFHASGCHSAAVPVRQKEHKADGKAACEL